jgi:hypothetical protein
VRDFTHPYAPYIDINRLTSPHDHKHLLQNEIENRLRNMQHIDTEEVSHPKVVIISDGYRFNEKQEILASLPKDVVVIAVNGALAAWRLLEGEKRQRIHYYVVNNPYQECMNFFPRKNRYFTKCIASMRTHPDFLRQFAKKGTMYRYLPTPEKDFMGMKSDAIYHIDDYRNPICAAVGLAYRMGVEKLLLYCCDDSFNDHREGAVQLENGLFTYPQQIISRDIIDGNFYWLKSQEDIDVQIRNCSSGPEYANAPYIQSTDIVDFFQGI